MRTEVAAGTCAVIAGLLVAGCAAAEGNEVSDSPSVNSDVTVAIYSGLEDPTFELSEDARTEVARQLGAIEPSLVASTPASAALGFRGFVVTRDRKSVV